THYTLVCIQIFLLGGAGTSQVHPQLEEGVIKGHMTLPNQQIGLTRPLLTSLVLENLDHVGRWTGENGAYEAKRPPVQDFFCLAGDFFSRRLFRGPSRRFSTS